MNFVMNYATSAGLIAGPVDLLTCSPVHYHYATTAPTVNFLSLFSVLWPKLVELIVMNPNLINSKAQDCCSVL